MHYAFGKGDICHRIDKLTISILDSIGWNIPDPGPQISIKEGAQYAGLYGATQEKSVYHSFTVRPAGDEINKNTPCHWEFYVFGRDNSMIKLQEGSEYLFTTDPILNPEQYQCNINGDVIGEFHLSVTIDGKEVEAEPHQVYFSRKPYIAWSTKHIAHEDSYSYDELLTVTFMGTDHLTVLFEEEISPTYVIKDFYTSPDSVMMQGFYMDDKLHKTFEATNEFGTTVKEDVFDYRHPWPPDLTHINKPSLAELMGPSTISEIMSCTTLIKVFNSDGSYRVTLTPDVDLETSLPSGIYYIHFILTDNSIIIKKIVI